MKHKVTFTFTNGNETIAKSVELTSEGEDNRDLSVANGVTDRLVDFEVDISQLKSLFIVSDKAITIETNDPGPSPSPQDTITLLANQPLVWQLGCGLDLPFSDDVTAIYITNASGGLATVSIRMLFDATP